MNAGRTVTRLAREESGQDIVEYALLAALIGVASIATWQVVGDVIGDTYGSATGIDGSVQDLSGCTPDPGGGGCG